MYHLSNPFSPISKQLLLSEKELVSVTEIMSVLKTVLRGEGDYRNKIESLDFYTTLTSLVS